MPRRARIDAPGILHHVMVRGIERRRIVKDDRDRSDFVSRMQRLAVETDTAIYAWALLSNHAHLLLRSSNYGLPRFMGRLLTGYVVTFNRRHHRCGHLFQNRYKSIVCEDELYFCELVRYIHLNPLRANLVSDLAELESFPWCGHAVLLGKKILECQDLDAVLSRFGSKVGAQHAYRQFVADGVEQGRRPEFSGSGVEETDGSQGASDRRILGSSDFTEHILMETSGSNETRPRGPLSGVDLGQLVRQMCDLAQISVEEIRSGSRRAKVTELRAKIVLELVKVRGVSQTETARQLGVSLSAVSKLVRKAEGQVA